MITNVVVEKYLYYEKLIEAEAISKTEFLLKRSEIKPENIQFDCIEDDLVYVSYEYKWGNDSHTFSIDFLWMTEEEIEKLLTQKEQERAEKRKELNKEKIKDFNRRIDEVEKKAKELGVFAVEGIYSNGDSESELYVIEQCLNFIEKKTKGE